MAYRFLTGKPFLMLSGLISAATAQTHVRGRSADSTRYTALMEHLERFSAARPQEVDWGVSLSV